MENRSYTNQIDYGTLSGTENIEEISKENWSSTTNGTVENNVWGYTGSGKNDSNESRTRTVTASGTYSFTKDTTTYSGNMEESIYDSITSKVNIESTLNSADEWVTSGGTSKSTSEGNSIFTFWGNATYTNESVAIDGQTYTGTKSVGARSGSEYSSNVESTFTNGNWSTPTGTAKTAEIHGVVAKVVGTSAYSTTVNGSSVSGSSDFKYTMTYDDKLVRNYVLNSQSAWGYTNKTFEGDWTIKFDLKFDVENQQYVKSDLTGLVQGSGSITGTLNHELEYTVDLKARYDFDKAGEDRVITGGVMSITKTRSYIDSYSGSGTYTRAIFNASAFSGTITESGSLNDYWTSTVNYSMATNSSGGKFWALSGATAMASGSKSSDFKAEGDGLDTESDIGVSISYAGVAIYYVGFDLGTNAGNHPWTYANSAGQTTSVNKHHVTTVDESESYSHKTSKNWFQDGTLEFDYSTLSWSWEFEGSGKTQSSGSWHHSITTEVDADTTTTWTAHNASFTANSKITSTANSGSDASWFNESKFEFVDGVWTEIGGRNLLTVIEYADHESVSTSSVSNQGGSFTISMNSRLESSGDYLGYYIRDLEGPTSAPSGTIAWGHNSSTESDFTSEAEYRVATSYTIQNYYYDAHTIETFTTFSAFTQEFAGTPTGTVTGTETYERTYAGGESVFAIMFNAYYHNSNYGDTDSWVWDDPNLSTFDPDFLETIPMRPLGSPQLSPVEFLPASPTQSVWAPPSLIQDPDQPAAGEGGGLTVRGILRDLIPGISLYDAYQSWKKGDYWSAAFYGAMGAVDLISMGAISKGKVIVKSGGKAIWGLAKSTAKGTKGLMDDAARLVLKNSDNVGKGLINDTAGGALRNRKVPWQYGNTNGALGITDKYGNITIQPGLRGQVLKETVRHEAVHRFLSPRSGPFLELRANIGAWAYHKSHLVQYIEEAIAETVGTRSLTHGLLFPFRGGYDISIARVFAEGGAYIFIVGGSSFIVYSISTD